MLFAREKNPDTALRIKEVEQNIWRHTISSAVAVAARPLKPNLQYVLASAKEEREGQRGRGGQWASVGGRVWEVEALAGD